MYMNNRNNVGDKDTSLIDTDAILQEPFKPKDVHLYLAHFIA